MLHFVDRMRAVYLMITVILLCTGYFLNSIYRPYIYSNNITDFGIADAGNNLIFVPGVHFLLLLIRNKPLTTYLGDILLILGVYMSIELFQLFGLIPGTFDWQDMTGLVIGAMVAFALTNHLHK